MKKYRLFSLLILTGVMTAAMVFPAFAAKKTPIKAVTIRATYTESDEEDELDMDESVEVVSSGTGYSLSSYEVENPDEVSEEGVNPHVKVYLSAKDGYYFNITKASQIKLQKCKYVSAARQDSSTTLVVTVELTEVKKKVGEIESLTLADDGRAEWLEAYNAGSYEVRVLRDDSRVANLTAAGTNTNIAQYFTRGGSYRFKVRGIHKADQNVKGEWAESNDIYITDEKARENREAAERAESAGDWITDGRGTRFRLPDGTFVAGAWRKINKQWYYFQPDSYMAKGWAQIDGSWYYLDPSTGAMWCNTTTPDGYTLGIDGRRAE